MSRLLRKIWKTGMMGGGDVLFSQRDDFTTALAAGSVNGTAAEPGAGTRTVVDSENKFSIGVAGATFAGPKTVADYGNPGFWLNAEARAAGKVMIASILTSPVNSKESFVGWTTAQNGSNMANVIYFGASNNIVSYDGGSGYNAIGTWAVGTVYRLAIVLRATGSFIFIKGGVWGYWTLLLATKVSNGATIYPSLNNYNAAYSATTLRVPQSTYLPIPLLSDSFNRTNGAAGISDGAAHAEANGGSGVTWSGTGAAIDTNKLKVTPTEGAELATGTLTVGIWYKITATDVDHFYSGCAINETFRATATTALDATNKVMALSDMFALTSLGTPDIYGEIDLSAFTEKTQCGLILRADSLTNPQNFIMCHRDGAGNIKVVECVAGVYTQLATIANAFAANEQWRISAYGTTVRLHKSTALMASATTAVTTGNIHGVFSTNSANRFDTLVVWPVGAEGQHAALQGFFNGLTEIGYLSIGDSKTACTSGIRWQDDMNNHVSRLEFMEFLPRIAGDGWRVTSPDFDYYLNQLSATPNYALINFGANDIGVTNEVDFKTTYLALLDNLHTRYPNIRCGLMRIWKRGVQTNINILDGWIDEIIALRSFAFAGPDERIYLENGDDGVTYTSDGTHPNDAGYTLTATQWRTSMGYS